MRPNGENGDRLCSVPGVRKRSFRTRNDRQRVHRFLAELLVKPPFYAPLLGAFDQLRYNGGGRGDRTPFPKELPLIRRVLAAS